MTAYFRALRARSRIIHTLATWQESVAYPILYAILCAISGSFDRFVYLPWIALQMLLFLIAVLFTKDKKTLVTFPAGRRPSNGRYTVPEGTEMIGEAAFYEATKLSSVVFPDSLKVIDEYGFAFCKNLYSATFGPNITRVGDTAYGFCTSLSEISFANPKTQIDNYCFTHCVNLKNFDLPAQIPPH